MPVYTQPTSGGGLALTVSQLPKTTTNINNNTTTLALALDIGVNSNRTSYHLDNTIPWNVKVGGVTVSSGTYNFDFRGSSKSKTIWSGNYTVGNASNGTLSVAVSGYSGDTGTPALGGPITVSGTFAGTGTTPNAPNITSLVPDSGTMNVTWTAPVGGSPPTSYRVKYSVNANLSSPQYVTIAAPTLTQSFPTTIGATYWVQVAGVNSAGIGAYSSIRSLAASTGGSIYISSNWEPVMRKIYISGNWEPVMRKIYISGNWEPIV